MPSKDAQIFQNLEGNLKFETPVMWHEGSSTLKTQKYQGTAAPNITPPPRPATSDPCTPAAVEKYFPA